jgi:hypothetical protein
LHAPALIHVSPSASGIRQKSARKCPRFKVSAMKRGEMSRPCYISHRAAVLSWVALAVVLVLPGAAHAFKLHVPCTSSHDCPRGAFCRHITNFRGQCITLARLPFGITGRRQNEFPPESDPIEHVFGSNPILRCSQRTPCPPGFVCAKYGSSKLQESLCVPYSEPCWSTADCSPDDICDKEDDELSLAGICRPREEMQ